MATISVPAIRFVQSGKHTLYSMVIDGKRIPEIACVSRVNRSNGHLMGYQRPEVVEHVNEIRDYIESSAPMLPNAIVVALDDRAEFVPGDAGSGSDIAVGVLTLPVDRENPCGWIVDGQQRVAAIRDANVGCFPVSVVAFVSDERNAHLEQFVFVNHTKALPSGLISELLPYIETRLPPALMKKLRPARLLEEINHDPESPFLMRIRTPTVPEGIIKDNSILRMLENSLTNGSLYHHARAGTLDIKGAKSVLYPFWRAVAVVFEDAWNLPPRRSRLLHGAGIIALGFLMDAIYSRYSASHEPTEEEYVADIATIAPYCRWTSGAWELAGGRQRQWNEIQNTPKDTRLLTELLLHIYRDRVIRQEKRSHEERGAELAA